MIIEPNKSGGYTAFQGIAGKGKKVGVACEAPTRKAAIEGAVEMFLNVRMTPGMAKIFKQTGNQKGVAK